MTDAKSPPSPGFRKDGKPFKEGNTREDGTHIIGKYRPPQSGKFSVGDGRKRGRRAAGVRNADTDFEKELARKITINEGGKARRASKSLASDIRLLDNGYNKGQTAALIEIDRRRQRIAEKTEARRNRNTESDAEILEAYMRQWAAAQNAGPRLLGDPEREHPDNPSQVAGVEDPDGSFQIENDDASGDIPDDEGLSDED